jgi:hypothetical protein
MDCLGTYVHHHVRIQPRYRLRGGGDESRWSTFDGRGDVGWPQRVGTFPLVVSSTVSCTKRRHCFPLSGSRWWHQTCAAQGRRIARYRLRVVLSTRVWKFLRCSVSVLRLVATMSLVMCSGEDQHIHLLVYGCGKAEHCLPPVSNVEHLLCRLCVHSEQTRVCICGDVRHKPRRAGYLASLVIRRMQSVNAPSQLLESLPSGRFDSCRPTQTQLFGYVPNDSTSIVVDSVREPLTAPTQLCIGVFRVSGRLSFARPITTDRTLD